MIRRATLLLLTLAFLSPALLAQTTSPVTIFSTLLGGSGQENLRDVTTDDAGNVYVTGGTSSADYPTTPGAYDRTFATGGSSLGSGGPMDVFVAKYAPDGTLLWSTLLGGPNYDRAYAIEVDADGYVYVGGRAGDQFPTTDGVLQEEFAGDRSPNGLYGKQDAFVAKLSPNGDSLIWATYFGADDIGFARDFDIDSEGAVYIAFTGATRPNQHITNGAYQTNNNGGKDLIVAKLSPDVTHVEWATYYGGGGDDGGGPAVRVHTDGTVTVVGSTNSNNLPRAGARSSVEFRGGGNDLFVARFSADGSELIYGTYFGGSGQESVETHTLAIDAEGNAWITGYTTSSDLPVTPGVFQSQRNGPADVPLAKFNAADGALLHCGYLGGSGGENAQGIAIGKDGKLVVGGGTSSVDFPTTPDAPQRTSTGGYDMTATVIEPDLSAIIWATRYGGSGEDDGRTLWADRNGNVILAGHTDSRNFPLLNEEQGAFGGGRNDGVIVRFTPPFKRAPNVTVNLSSRCEIYGEGEVDSIRVSLLPAHFLDSSVTVQLRVSGSATHGQDFFFTDTVVTFAAQSFVGISFIIPIVNDEIAEPVEVIEITATIPSGPGIIGVNDVSRIYLIDDDSPTPNLLTDPGFEEETSGWQKTTNGGRSVATDRPHSGEHSAKIVGSNQYVREIYQDVSITPGALYLLRSYTWAQRLDVADVGTEIIWFDGAGKEVGRTPFMHATFRWPAGWAYSSGCAQAPENALVARYRIALTVEEDNDGIVWFDDLGFYRADDLSGVEEGDLVPDELDLSSSSITRP